ncbi:MAG: iron-containing alcohol dehydrogenase [Chloroflexota bacterium]
MLYTTVSTYHLPTRIQFGIGAAATVAEEAKKLGGTRALIVTDKGIVKAGLLDKILPLLEVAGIGCAVYDDVPPEPPIEAVEEGLRRYQESGADFMIAIGGGSPLDTAKSIGLLVNNPGPLHKYDNLGAVPNRIPPLITIPTTAGTGAEATTGSIIADHERKLKMNIGHANIAPWVALVDPEMTRALPPHLTAYTGMDALTHGIERYVNRGAVPHTDAVALHCVRYVSRYLRRAIMNGGDLEARQNVLAGSLMGGMARTGSGNAHAIAHTLSAHYGTHHGLANALVLPAVMQFNLPARQERFADLAEAMGEKTDLLSVAEAADRSVQVVRRLAADVGIPSGLRAVGIPEADLPELAKAVVADNPRLLNSNPRKATEQDILGILQASY